MQNTVLLKFFVTFDLDVLSNVERTPRSLQLHEDEHYLPIVVDGAGKRCIEGLLPTSIQTAVYAANPDLVQAMRSGGSEERKSAVCRLRSLLLEKSEATARPGRNDYGHLYPLVEMINRAFA